MTMPRQPRPRLGEQELALLRYVTEQGKPLTVGEVLEGYGVPNGLSRSTVVTVMERLRKKGYLTRSSGDGGVFRYEAEDAEEEVMGGLVQRFIERTLAGSLTPLAAYFANRKKLSADEVDQLQQLLAKLEDTEKGEDAKP